ncbi:MAG: carboxylating nicotinate-nucleotide diphosphorylase [Rhizomicrobium sp.]
MSSPSILRPPHPLLVDPIVRRALEEDLGRAGDLTTDLLIPPDQPAEARLVVRAAGTLAGIICADRAFRLVDGNVRVAAHAPDGARVNAGDTIAAVAGPARALLTGERVALNFLGHLSGVATATRALVDAVDGTGARIVCTRKTMPGLRILEKYAVRCGGGFNHRFGLDDAVLIKDNHVAAAGGLRNAVERARHALGHMAVLELEVGTLDELDEALSLGVGSILLDNMSPHLLRRAVELSAGRAILEASGGISLANVRAVAETGVNYISSGAITHSSPGLDVALDF